MDYNIKDLEEWNEKIEKKAIELGLDFYPGDMYQNPYPSNAGMY